VLEEEPEAPKNWKRILVLLKAKIHWEGQLEERTMIPWVKKNNEYFFQTVFLRLCSYKKDFVREKMHWN